MEHLVQYHIVIGKCCLILQYNILPIFCIVKQLPFISIICVYNFFVVFRMTALVLKVLSMVAERQSMSIGTQGRQAWAVPLEYIRGPVSFLLSAQKSDGSFGDPHKVRHRTMLVSSNMHEHA